MFDKLKAPFPPEKISWRVGARTQDKKKGIALAYIDARDVMERLDDVVGPENWQDRYEFHGSRTVCYLSLRLEGEWIIKADGAGDSDVEAEKGAISDALKRAAVKWGIGRDLYDMPNLWVDLKNEKFIEPSEIEKKLFPALEELTKGNVPVVEEKYTPAQRETQSVIITRLHMCQNDVEMDSLVDELSKAIEGLPEEMSSQINDQIQNLRDLLKQGKTIPYPTHKFTAVSHAENWETKALDAISKIKSLKALDSWESEKKPFIEGLGSTLKAQKYVKDGKSPKERCLQALMDKRVELESINTLNTPIVG